MTSQEDGEGIVDTGLGGGTLFAFAWQSEDPLSRLIAPRRYGRVEIDAGIDRLCQGVIVDVVPAVHPETGDEVEGVWILNINASGEDAVPVAAAVASDNLAVRVLS